MLIAVAVTVGLLALFLIALLAWLAGVLACWLFAQVVDSCAGPDRRRHIAQCQAVDAPSVSEERARLARGAARVEAWACQLDEIRGLPCSEEPHRRAA